MTSKRVALFNGPLDTGMRTVNLLLAAYPEVLDLQQLVTLDYLVVHTADVGGPSSLHTRLPLREAELIIRRRLVEEGLRLMAARGLVDAAVQEDGIYYSAGECAHTFVACMTSEYLVRLKECSEWVIGHFGNVDTQSLREEVSSLFGQWMHEFQEVDQGMGAQTP